MTIWPYITPEVSSNTTRMDVAWRSDVAGIGPYFGSQQISGRNTIGAFGGMFAGQQQIGPSLQQQLAPLLGNAITQQKRLPIEGEPDAVLNSIIAFGRPVPWNEVAGKFTVAFLFSGLVTFLVTLALP